MLKMVDVVQNDGTKMNAKVGIKKEINEQGRGECDFENS